MSTDSQFSQWATKVAQVAQTNEHAPALFWDAMKGCLQEAANTLNSAFERDAVVLSHDPPYAVCAKYNNRLLMVAIDLTMGRLDYHISVLSNDKVVVEDVFHGFVRLRLQSGPHEVVKAEESSFEQLAWLSSQSLRFWPLSARVSQYLLQKLVAPELSDSDFIRP